MDTPWLPGQTLSPYAEYRLFCLPHAGGAAASYRRWRAVAPSSVQVCPVELPGRGSRLREEPFQRLAPLVRSLADSLEPAFDRPFALFGHSMGGLLVFELARVLRERGGQLPIHLFVSAAAAPGTTLTRRHVHQAPDAEVKDRLRSLNGTPAELLDDAELMELMLPAVRADFSVLETYEYRDQPPLPIPITVFGGTTDDETPQRALRGWRRHSVAGARVRLFPGDHFFLHTSAVEVLSAVVDTLYAGSRL